MISVYHSKLIQIDMNYLGGDLNAYKIINDYSKDELHRVLIHMAKLIRLKN